MAITPQAGYIIDPNNPNGVIQDPNAQIGMGGVPMPAAQAPVTPTPLPPTPAAPTTSSTETTTTGTTPTQPTLTMPASGSVVDLLGAAGQDSSYAARQQLAKQYGIQGYTGTGAQNTELANKYLEAYNATKGKTAPESGAEARSALSPLTSQVEQPQNPQAQFFDAYSGMDPISANIFQQLSTLASSTTNKQSLTDFYKQEIAAQGIPELNMELADINRIMEGTEDDIRDEINNAGGFVTESQVQALTGARNKNLLKKANYLSDVLNAKNDYVDRIVSLTQADRKEVSEELDRKLGITKTLFDMSQQMTRNAKENYQQIIDTVGWEGLAKTLGGNKEQIAKAESLLGLPPGGLDAMSKLKKPLSEMDKLDLENKRLQNLKLQSDLSAGPSIQTQVVDVDGKKVLINSKTGAKIADITTGTGTTNLLGMSLTQSKISEISNLIKDPSLSAAVGTSGLGRVSPFELFTGGRSTFIGGVQNLLENLTFDKLGQIKSTGVTFGSLTEGERGSVAAAATKLNSPAWTVRDEAGNIIGWKVSEDVFKAEMDKINYFTKLDYVLKGGDPALGDIQEMPDGSLWVQNSDGTLSKLI